MPPSRRDDLIDAAMRVFYRHGFHASSLDDIQKEGGISRMTLYNHFKSKDELVVAAIFVAAVGLGPFAGVMALALHTTGVLAKLFSEAVEAIDDGPVEGVRATGAGPMNEVVWGVIPQVIPLWASYALYRFESNTRAATILGLIGAGGIGQVLIQNIRSFEYGKTATILLIIIAAVTAVDLISQMLRKRLV